MNAIVQKIKAIAQIKPFEEEEETLTSLCQCGLHHNQAACATSPPEYATAVRFGVRFSKQG